MAVSGFLGVQALPGMQSGINIASWRNTVHNRETGMTPEAKARTTIDHLLLQAGWHVCGVADANIHAARGVAIREFPLNSGFGFAVDIE